MGRRSLDLGEEQAGGIVSTTDRNWTGTGTGPEPEPEPERRARQVTRLAVHHKVLHKVMTSAEIDLGAFTLSIRRAYITGASERCCPCVLFSTPSASKSTPTSEPPRYLRRFRASAAKYDTSLVSTVKRVYFGPAPEPERRGGRLVTAGRADHDRRCHRLRRLLQGTARPCESPPRTCERGRRAPRTPQSTRAACSRCSRGGHRRA